MISAIVVLLYISLQLEYELASSTRFGQFCKFGKLELGASPSPAARKKTVSTPVPSFFLGYLRVRFDLSSIKVRDISGLPKLGVITLTRSHPRGPSVVPLDSTGGFPISQ